MKKTNNKGFSLIELIIVIAIMAVLVAIIAPNLTKYLGKSKKNTDNKNKDEIESTLKTCLTDYDMENNALIADGDTSTEVKIKWQEASGTVTASVTAGITDSTVKSKFATIVNSAVDGAKTKSKEDSQKFAQATIKKNSSNAYVITVSFAS